MGSTGAGSGAYAQEEEFTAGNSGLTPGGGGIPITANLLAHYDATAITGQADGSTLSAWADSSPNGYNLATSGTNPPTYYSTTSANLIGGKASVKFASASVNRMKAAAVPNTAAPLTLYVVQKAADTNNHAHLSEGTNTNSLLVWTAPQWNVAQGGSISGGVFDLNAHTETVVINGASSLIRVDGTQVASGTTGTAGIGGGGGILIGDWAGSLGSYLMNGLLGEWAIYSAAHNTTQMGQVETYLKSKWGTP